MLCVNIAFFLPCLVVTSKKKLSSFRATTAHPSTCKITAPISIVRKKNQCRNVLQIFILILKASSQKVSEKQRMQISLDLFFMNKNCFYTVIQKFRWSGLKKIREGGEEKFWKCKRKTIKNFLINFKRFPTNPSVLSPRPPHFDLISISISSDIKTDPKMPPHPIPKPIFSHEINEHERAMYL